MQPDNHDSGRVSPNQRQRHGGGRVSPNGRRSPNSYYERVTAVRFVMPSSGKTMCTKLNRVVRTKAPINHDVCLCESFLSGHCNNGHKCRLAHVPRQCLWEYLLPTINPETRTYEAGFSISCYTPEMDTYYEIPSEYIFQTKGSEKYVQLFNDNGDNFKEKLCLCPTIVETGGCSLGFECENVHPVVADLSRFKCIRTHVATADAVQRYERLPAHIHVRAHVPNTGEEEDTIYAGDDVLCTVGAMQYAEAYTREGGFPSVKMQHCAHFQNKKMCRLGDGCRFLHVVSLALSTPMQESSGSTWVSPADRALSPTDSCIPAAAAGQNSSQNTYVNAPGRICKNDAALMALAGLVNGAAAAPSDPGSSPIAMNLPSSGSSADQPQTQSLPQPQTVAAPQQPYPHTAQPLPPSSGARLSPVQGPGFGELRRSPTRRNNPYILSQRSVN